jgi:molecular chaperone GrpE
MSDPRAKKPDTPQDAASAPGNGSGGKPAGEAEGLRAQLQAAQKERDDYLGLAQRVKADFDNYQKRQARDLAEERRYAQAPLALDLLTPLDNLDRAVAAAKQAGDNSPLAQGVYMVQGQLLEVLRRHGVTRIDAEGKPFDPNKHQAVLQQPSAQVPPNTVLQVLEQGYMIHDRVLRAARVVVSAAPVK